VANSYKGASRLAYLSSFAALVQLVQGASDLSFKMAAGLGFRRPLSRVAIALVHAVALVVHAREHVLRSSVTLVGR